MYIKRRSLLILQQLLNLEDPISLQKLSAQNKISERTIRYDIDDLNFFLKPLKIKIDVSKKRGVSLNITDTEKQCLLEQLKTLNRDNLFFSVQERVDFIIIKLLSSPTPVTIASLADEIGISRTSLNNSMKDVYHWFDSLGIKVIKKTNYGIKLEYTENQYRKAVVKLSNREDNKTFFYQLLLKDNTNYSDNFLNPANYVLPYYFEALFDEIDFYKMMDALGYLEELMDFKFADSSYISLLIHLTMAIKRLRKNRTIEMSSYQLQCLQQTNEFQIAQRFGELLEAEFGIDIPPEEIGYISLHLMGATSRKRNPLLKEEDSIRQIAKEIVNRTEKYLGFHIGSNYIGELIDDLVIHLSPAFIRLKYDMLITNPILDMIKDQYSNIFEATLMSCKEVSAEYGLFSFPDDEIAFIAMHIGATLEKIRRNSAEKIKVAIMCSSGIGTAKMLSNRLQNEFQQLCVVGELSLTNFSQLDNMDISMVITTIDIPFNYSKPIIQVSPLLTDHDIKKIEDLLNITRSSWNNALNKGLDKTINDIVRIAEQNSIAINKSAVKQHLFHYFTGPKNLYETNFPSLSDLINHNMIIIDYPANNWEDAVRQSGKLLVDSHCASQGYVDAMVSTIKELGPYVVISDGIALPHAGSGLGVSKTAISVVVLKDPVSFGHTHNDPVKLVFGLCAKNNYDHIQAMSDIGRIASEKSIFDKLVSSSSPSQVYDLIHYICKTK